MHMMTPLFCCSFLFFVFYFFIFDLLASEMEFNTSDEDFDTSDFGGFGEDPDFGGIRIDLSKLFKGMK